MIIHYSCNNILESHTWTKVGTQGELPLGRAYHAAAYYKGRYIVWGGEKSHAQCISSIYECQLEGRVLI